MRAMPPNRLTTALAIASVVAALLGGCIAEGPVPGSATARAPVGTAQASISTATPAATLVAIDLGPSGSLVVARTREDVISVVTIAPDGTERAIGAERSLAGLVSGYCCVQGAFWLGPDGLLLMEVQLDTEQTTTEIVGISLANPAAEPLVMPDGRPLFLAGDTLALVSGATTLFDAEHPSGIRLAVPDEVGIFGTTADRSRLVGISARDGDGGNVVLTPVVVGRDGAVGPWSPALGIGLTTGVERTIGARGETLSQWCDDGPLGGSCGLNVVRPGIADPGRNIAPRGGGVGGFAWTPDGSSVVMTTGDGLYAWSGGSTSKVRDLPAGVRDGLSLHLAGLTGDQIIVSDDSGELWALPVAGGPERRVDGALLAIVQ